MSLPMPSPVKHSKTGTYYLRQRVPVDLKEKAQGKSVALPVDKALKSVTIGESVKVSLATKDPAEAKARYREADAALSKFWEANCGQGFRRKALYLPPLIDKVS